MRINVYLYISAVVFTLSLSACGIKDKKTTLEIKDPDRHYYPILRGQILDIMYEVENTGDSPLFITDIHASCGCILVDKTALKVIPAGGKGAVHIQYDSNKNIGYVKHYITIYANLMHTDHKEITFDLHVVPNALYTRDYEELHRDHKEKQLNEKTLVDGNENNLRYYVDNITER